MKSTGKVIYGFLTLLLVVSCSKQPELTELEYEETNNFSFVDPKQTGDGTPCKDEASLGQLEKIYQDIFSDSSKCMGCHVMGSAGGLSLKVENSDYAGLCRTLYENDRIDVEEPDNSKLLAKAGYGSLPHGGGTPLNNEEIQVIREWIEKEQAIADGTDAGNDDGAGDDGGDDKVAGNEKPEVSLKVASSVVKEDAKIVDLTFELDAAYTEDVQVKLDVVPEGPVMYQDYVITSDAFTIPAGTTSFVYSIYIIDDSNMETDEKLTISIREAVNATIATMDPVQLILLDNDTPPDMVKTYVNFVDSTIVVDESAGTIQIPVRLSDKLSKTSAVNFEVTHVSTNNSDLATTSGSVTFIAGSESGNLEITIVNDTDTEDLESFKVTLKEPMNLVLGDKKELTVNIQKSDEQESDVIDLCAGDKLAYFESNVKPVLTQSSGLACTICHSSFNKFELDNSSSLTLCKSAKTRINADVPEDSMLINMPLNGSHMGKGHGGGANLITADQANYIKEWIGKVPDEKEPEDKGPVPVAASFCEGNQLEYFKRNVHSSFGKCIGCHKAGGFSQNLDLNSQDVATVCQKIIPYTNSKSPASSMIIEYPVNGKYGDVNHPGGANILSSSEADYLKKWIEGEEYVEPAELPTLAFDKNTYVVEENAGTVKVIVKASKAVTNDVKFELKTTGDTAIPGMDYELSQLEYSIAKNSSQVEISVSIVNDDEVEPAETFTLELKSDSSFNIAENAEKTTITINNDDQENETPGVQELAGIDIGPVAQAGSHTLIDGQLVVKGSGQDIWGAADEFYYAHKAVDGDVEASGKIESVKETHIYAKAGVMLRASLDPGAAFAMIQMIPENNEIKFQWRETSGGGNQLMKATNQAFRYAKVVRKGNYFSGFTSEDGKQWQHVHTVQINMDQQIYAGFANTANADQLSEANFSDIKINDFNDSETRLASSEIGNVQTFGDFQYNDETGQFAVTGSGDDIWGTEDSFRMAYQQLLADGEISAKIDSLEATATYAKAGIMIRDSLAPNAAYGLVVLTAGDGLRFHWRQGTGQTTNVKMAPDGQQSHRYVKLVKVGNDLIASTSADGNNWIEFHTQSMNFSAETMVGLVATSYNNNVLTTALYSDLKIIDNEKQKLATACKDAGAMSKLYQIKMSIFDSKCVGCHNAQTTSGNLDLSGDLDATCQALSLNERLDLNIPGESKVIYKAGYAQPTHGGGALLTKTEIDQVIDFIDHESKARGFDPKPPYPFIEFSQSAQTVAESVGDVSVDVTLSDTYPEDITFGISTSESSAHASDFVLATDTFTIAAGEKKLNIILSINNDEYKENEEFVTLRLVDVVNAKNGQELNFKVTITDDDESKQIQGQDWKGQDIGNVATAGSFTLAGGTLEVKGAGDDIWGADDDFFYVFKVMRGDGALVARIDSLENTSSYAKAGLMIRETLETSSKYSFIVRTAENGLRHHSKLENLATPVVDFAADARQGDAFVKVEREGDNFNTYSSADGVSWSLISSVEISMNEEVYVGLVNCSQKDYLSSAVYSNILSQFDETNLKDNDEDGIPDLYDEDDDNDGVADVDDKFPDDSKESADFDGDGVGDLADNDDDNDGVIDSEDPAPNNPYQPPLPDGEELFSTYCIGCHEPRDKHGRSFDKIKESFDVVASMNNLKDELNDRQVRAIEKYLQDAIYGPKDEGGIKFKVPVGGTRYLVSKFKYLFVADSGGGDNYTIEQVIRTNIENRKAVFGEPCSPNDKDCLVPCTDAEINWSKYRWKSDDPNYGKKLPNSTGTCLDVNKASKPGYYFNNTNSAKDGWSRMQSNMTANMIAMSNATRKGFLIKTCEKVLDFDTAVSNALARAGLNVNSAANAPNMQVLIETFLPGQPQFDGQVNALINVYNKAKSDGMSNADAWKHVLAPLCMSESFEVI
jgi:regulation of enolase protein 1 (concanavalin A-like superfamily)